MARREIIPQRIKDPEAKKVYGFDWTNELGAGESIASSDWFIETEEATSTLLEYGTSTIDGVITSFGVEGGTLGIPYILRNHVTIDPTNEVLVKSIELRIERE